MNYHFPSVTILLTAAIYAGFAAWLGLNPTALLAAFNMEQSTPQMLTEIRAFYGGIELGIAVAMLILWQRGNLFAAALIGGLPLAGSACGRLIGQVLDDGSTLHLLLALPETAGAAACLLCCWRLRRPYRDGDYQNPYS